MIRACLTSVLLAGSALAETPSQRVGQPLVLTEIYLPGDEVKPLPRRDREPPLVVRVLDVRPAKDGFRYDFEVHGLEPGEYDLTDFLEGAEAMPAVPLEITTPLEPGVVLPHPLAAGELPELGGYRKTMIAVGAAWLAGLIGIVAWRKRKPAETPANSPPPGIAERLRPLVDRASRCELSADDRARLERLVIGHWRERFPEVASLAPAEAMAKLRHHPEAAPLVLALERWLHAPSGSTPPADLDRLLAPYR